MDERERPDDSGPEDRPPDAPPILEELKEIEDAVAPPAPAVRPNAAPRTDPAPAAAVEEPPAPNQPPSAEREPPPRRELTGTATTTPAEDDEPSPADVIPQAWRELLENRLIILGMSGIVLLLLAVGILFVFSRGGDASAPRTIAAAATTTPEPTSFPDTRLVGEALETTTMRNGPSRGFVPLGTIPKGALVPVVGRNEQKTWLQVTYPSGSPLRGWVEAEFLDVSGDISQLVIAGPGPRPDLTVPTSTFRTPEPTEPPAVATDTPTPTDEPAPTQIPASTATPDQPQPTKEPPASTPGDQGDPA